MSDGDVLPENTFAETLLVGQLLQLDMMSIIFLSNLEVKPVVMSAGVVLLSMSVPM